MKKIVCILIIIFAALAGAAQYKTIDSLQLLLQQTKTDTAKIRKLIQLGMAYREIKNDSALAYFKDALQLSQKIGYSKGEIRVGLGGLKGVGEAAVFSLPKHSILLYKICSVLVPRYLFLYHAFGSSSSKACPPRCRPRS